MHLMCIGCTNGKYFPDIQLTAIRQIKTCQISRGFTIPNTHCQYFLLVKIVDKSL